MRLDSSLFIKIPFYGLRLTYYCMFRWGFFKNKNKHILSHDVYNCSATLLRQTRQNKHNHPPLPSLSLILSLMHTHNSLAAEPFNAAMFSVSVTPPCKKTTTLTATSHVRGGAAHMFTRVSHSHTHAHTQGGKSRQSCNKTDPSISVAGLNPLFHFAS